MLRAGLAALACLLAGAALSSNAPLPFKMGGPFELIDDAGNPRNQINPDGHAQLLFFGYANCPGICTAALPLIGDTTALLAEQGITVQPLMITVDPERDMVGSMDAALAKYHPSFKGLTGSDAALRAARKAFSVQHELAFVDPQYGAIYVHGSVIFLLNADGDVLTLFQPIQDAAHVADVAKGYLTTN
ncbi:MAG: SCO family protein [Arenibacterium sp.]